MKDYNLYQQIKMAKKEQRVASAKRYEMELAMEREIEAAIGPIKAKYDSVLKELESEESDKISKVWDVGSICHDCGRFYRYDIVNIFAILLSYIEGEKFIPFSSSEVSQNSIIIKEEVTKQFDSIDYDILDFLYKKGYLVMLDDGFSTMVDFYNNVGDLNSSFGNFYYLREFVNRLIQYRFDNGKRNVTDVTMEDLYSFMCNFISTHPDLAQKNKEKRDKMLARPRKGEPVIAECMKLEVMLKK